MDEFEKLYSVEDIANMSSLTSRTIRNYLKSGILQGQKIGGQWRFTKDNIRKLFDYSSFSKDISGKNREQILNFLNDTTDMTADIKVCTVIDCYCENKIKGHQIYKDLVAVINQNDFQEAKFDYEYIESNKKARFTLLGNPDFVVKTLQKLS